jgi:excisionase family DNA binding protein
VALARPALAERDLTVSEAAVIVGVHPNTLRSYADQGLLAYKRLPGGHRRFRREDLEAFRERLLSPAVTEPTAAQIAKLQQEFGEDKLGDEI